MTPNEVFAAEGANWPRPPPINTPVDKRVGNGFCDYHGEKGHSTDECIQLKKQIEKMSWQRNIKQKISLKFSPGMEITFPILTADNITEGPLTIEANLEGPTAARDIPFDRLQWGSQTVLLSNRITPDSARWVVSQTLYQQVGAIRGTNTSNTTLPWNTTHLTATSSSHAPGGDRVDLFVTPAPHLPVPTTYSQPPPYKACDPTHPGVMG
ncbi:hypothetical protein Tco_0503941 [Tanacetum coccineum]